MKESFNPSDEEYKKVEDLPEEHQGEFTDTSKELGEGFVKKEAMERVEGATLVTQDKIGDNESMDILQGLALEKKEKKESDKYKTEEEIRKERRMVIIKELEQEWEALHGPMERQLSKQEIKKNKETEQAWGKEWDGSTTRITEAASEFFFDHEGMGKSSAPRKADKILLERFPEYAEKEKTRIHENPFNDPAIEKYEQYIERRMSQEDIVKSIIEKKSTRQEEFDRISSTWWSSFITNYPEKADGYKDKFKPIKKAFENKERRLGAWAERKEEELAFQERKYLEEEKEQKIKLKENKKPEETERKLAEKSIEEIQHEKYTERFKKKAEESKKIHFEWLKEREKAYSDEASPEIKPERLREEEKTRREKEDQGRISEIRESLGLEEAEEGVEEEITYKALSQEKEDFKSEQSYGGRLAEYITGLKLDDPKMLERLTEDQKIIRAKYGLLAFNMRFDEPSEYERILLDKAKKLGVKIRSKSEMGQFFIEHPYAGGVFYGEENKIGVDIDRGNIDSYQESLQTLEHELIHALQDVGSSRMPIELMEYEAYIANSNFSYPKEGPSAHEMLRTFFDFAVGVSVNHWYKKESERKNMDIKPEWDNPEFFLDNTDMAQKSHANEHGKESFDTIEASSENIESIAEEAIQEITNNMREITDIFRKREEQKLNNINHEDFIPMITYAIKGLEGAISEGGEIDQDKIILGIGRAWMAMDTFKQVKSSEAVSEDPASLEQLNHTFDKLFKSTESFRRKLSSIEGAPYTKTEDALSSLSERINSIGIFLNKKIELASRYLRR